MSRAVVVVSVALAASVCVNAVLLLERSRTTDLPVRCRRSYLRRSLVRMLLGNRPDGKAVRQRSSIPSARQRRRCIPSYHARRALAHALDRHERQRGPRRKPVSAGVRFAYMVAP